MSLGARILGTVPAADYDAAMAENNRLRKLLALHLLRQGALDERRATRQTVQALRDPINAELCVREEAGVVTCWIEPIRSDDLVYRPAGVQP